MSRQMLLDGLSCTHLYYFGVSKPSLPLQMFQLTVIRLQPMHIA